jgi:stage V sporulation protein D (sporulation-specific penicillin-binding protein)
MRRRLGWLRASLLLFGAILFVRLVQVQVFEHDSYTALAASIHQRKYEVPAKRGNIYLRDGEATTPLVMSQSLKLLYADPSFVTDKVKTARALADATGDSYDRLYGLLAKGGEYVALKNRLPVATADKINALNLPGIGLVDQTYRVYPEGSLASQLAGFVNADGVGQYGLEGYLNDDLSGKVGLLKAKTDTRGIPIATANNVIKPPVDGNSYVVTIDRSIQAQAEKFLKAGVESVGAKSGSVIIMDPKTGAVTAMANYPTYDPNNFGSISDYSVFSNSAVSSQFEPGSGFKVITMSAGLDTGKVKPDTTYNDTGLEQISGRDIRNAENHKFGIQSMTDVIQKSLNTGVIFVLKSLGGDPTKITLAGKKVLYDYITKHFGFGVRTGIEQAGEAAGQVNQPTTQDVNYANMTFGQGISVTMVQMASAVSAIANGGKLYQPYLVDQIQKPDGTTVTNQPKLVNGHVISPQAASDISTMMEQVVLHGSGYMTKIKGYRVAGKTGTRMARTSARSSALRPSRTQGSS